MRILCITSAPYGANSFYRLTGIMPSLRKRLEQKFKRSVDFNVIPSEQLPSWAVLMEHDLILAHVPGSPAMATMLEFAKSIGIKIWCDYDDFIIGVPLENKVYELYNDSAIRDSAIKCLQVADIVTVTTNHLKDQFTPYNKNIQVIPNAFNDDVFRQDVINNQNKIVMWRGSDTHQLSIITFQNQLNKLIEECPNGWSFVFNGHHPWGVLYTNHVKYVPGQDVINYHFNGRKILPSIIQIIMTDNTFNRCRSKVGFIEGNHFGAMTLAPDWEEWRIPGVLNYKDINEYYSILHGLLRGEFDIHKIYKQGYDYIKGNLLLSKINEKRVDIVKTLLG